MKHAIGIIGYGGMAGYHYDSLAGYDRAYVKGVFDTNAARLEKAKEQGLTAYKSKEELLSDPEIDLVLIATTNDAHAELSKEALRAGKNVICEKPATLNAAQLSEVIETAKKCKRVFTVDQNRRTNRDYLLMRKKLGEGHIGKPYIIESRVEGSRGMTAWRTVKRLGGGIMLDWGVHLIDQILFMTKEKVASIYCKTYKVRYSEVEDNFKLILTFESGLTAYIEVATNNYIMHPRWYICGERGTLQIDDWSCGGRIVRCAEGGDSCTEEIIYTQAGPTKTMLPRRPEETETLEFSADDSIVDNFTAVYDQFIDAVEGKAELTIAPEQTMRVMKVIDAAFESAEKDSVIHLVI